MYLDSKEHINYMNLYWRFKFWRGLMQGGVLSNAVFSFIYVFYDIAPKEIQENYKNCLRISD